MSSICSEVYSRVLYNCGSDSTCFWVACQPVVCARVNVIPVGKVNGL